MIDPSNVINFNRTESELEEFLLFCICVAGHNAKSTAQALQRFLKPAFDAGISPFEYIQLNKAWQTTIAHALKEAGIGRQSIISACLCHIGDDWEDGKLDLKTCSAEDLEKYRGIGPKTSRYFLLYTRPNQNNIAVLDVHVLNWLRNKGHAAPKSTPTGKRYRELEQIFCKYASEAGKSVAEFDLEIWKSGSGNGS